MANDYASSEGMDMSTLIMYEEMEEENAGDKEYDQVDNSNSNNNSGTNRDY